MTVPAPKPDFFDEALAFVLGWEGGVSNHEADRGGLTNCGITQAAYDRWRKAKGLPPRPVTMALTDEIRAIYREDYWDVIRADGIAATSTKMALCVFDGAVNHGVGASAKMFQRTVQVEPDGKIGQTTLACFRLRLLKVSERQLLAIYLERRRGIYAGLILRDRRQEVFRNGWKNRLNSLAARVGLAPIWED